MLLHSGCEITIKSQYFRQRLHDNDQSKNGEMYAYSDAAFWLFTRHRFVWNVGVAFLGEHARARCYSLVSTNQSERRNSLLIDAV